MNIQLEKQGPVSIVRPSGRIDSANAISFEQVITASVGDARFVLLDFSFVNYISSAGLRCALLAVKLARASGARLAMCALNAQIHQVFVMCGFTSLFLIFDDVESGLRALA